MRDIVSKAEVTQSDTDLCVVVTSLAHAEADTRHLLDPFADRTSESLKGFPNV